jgi:hypothetical protein
MIQLYLSLAEWARYSDVKICIILQSGQHRIDVLILVNSRDSPIRAMAIKRKGSGHARHARHGTHGKHQILS